MRQRIVRGRRGRAMPYVAMIFAGVGALLQPISAVAQTAESAKVAGPEIRLADNVFVVPDPYAKTITGWVLIRAGCADEAETCQGVAHYLEHLLFINRDADHRSKVALFPSGNGNGWTSHASTGYTQTFPVKAETKAADLDKLVGYLAGLLQDVRADASQADRERNIVLQEHLQRSNSPQARFFQKRTAALLPNDPLGKSVGGDPDTIKAFDIPRSVAFHKTWYATNNAAFVFSGPVNADDLKPLVEKHIAPLTPRAVPDRAWRKPVEVSPKRISLTEADKDVKQPLVTYDKLLRYAVPTSQREQMTMDSALGIVSIYFASRMTGSPLHTMIDKNETIATGSFGLQKVRPGMIRLSFTGTPAAGVTPQRLAEAVRRYVDGLKPDLITVEYLQRLKKRSSVGRELIREEPGRYVNGLVNWLQGQYPYEFWRDRGAIDDKLDIRQVNMWLRALARPGRDVVGFLNPLDEKKAAPKSAGAP